MPWPRWTAGSSCPSPSSIRFGTSGSPRPSWPTARRFGWPTLRVGPPMSGPASSRADSRPRRIGWRPPRWLAIPARSRRSSRAVSASMPCMTPCGGSAPGSGADRSMRRTAARRGCRARQVGEEPARARLPRRRRTRVRGAARTPHPCEPACVRAAATAGRSAIGVGARAGPRRGGRDRAALP